MSAPILITGCPSGIGRATAGRLARNPRARYRVTPIARALAALRGVLGDRGFDPFLRTQIKAPS